MQSRRSPHYEADSGSQRSHRADDDQIESREPPYNMEAEQSVLGAILLDNSVLHDIVPLLKKPEDFFRIPHQIVYQAMCDMYNKCMEIDAVTLADELERRGIFKKVGGDNLLTELAGSISHAENALYHADIVKQKAVVRNWIATGNDIVKKGYSNLFSAKQLQEMAEKAIYAASEDRASGAAVGVGVVVKEILNDIGKAKEGLCTGISTGLEELDRLLQGLRPQKMIVIAGRTGEGKTALALEIALHAGVKQYSTLFVSLEMDKTELGHRWIASKAQIDSRKLTDNDPFTDDETRRISKAAGILNGARLFVSDSPSQSLMDISACARRLKQRNNLELLVVDYLGLIEMSQGKNENTTDAVGRISRGLKMLAKELKIPVIVLHQLNRESAKENREPKLHDLRSSGAIEQDADTVILLHSGMSEEDTEGHIVGIVAKNRGGPRGRVTFYYNKKWNKFDCVAKTGQLRAADFENDPYDNPDRAPFNDR